MLKRKYERFDDIVLNVCYVLWCCVVGCVRGCTCVYICVWHMGLMSYVHVDKVVGKLWIKLAGVC